MAQQCEILEPRDIESIQLMDNYSGPLIVDGVGRDGYHHVLAQILAEGWDEDTAYEKADDFWRSIPCGTTWILDAEAEERFNDYVLSKE